MPTERIGDTVVKTYSEELRWQWGREVAFLRKVKCVGGFAQIVSVGDHSITLRAHGDSLDKVAIPTDKLRDGLKYIIPLLDHLEIKHRDITIHNLLWDGEDLVLTDFGWSRWSWEPDTPIPPPPSMRGLYRPDWEQAADVIRQIEENAGV